ncbi:MAG: hypothetical protein JNL50_02920 [Phycisphaerae bacterium]|nr:hypothetical protein [Phycisphaerae bacterium]
MPQSTTRGTSRGPIGIDLHLRIRLAPAQREPFFAFLREAIPFYERPGGIRVELLADAADDHRFIEVVHYATELDYQRDQARVANDPTMKEILERWRAFLAEPPIVETYQRHTL